MDTDKLAFLCCAIVLVGNMVFLFAQAPVFGGVLLFAAVVAVLGAVMVCDLEE